MESENAQKYRISEWAVFHSWKPRAIWKLYSCKSLANRFDKNFDARAFFQQNFAKENLKCCQITTIYRISSWVMQKSDFHMGKFQQICTWVTRKSDFFSVVQWQFHKIYGNLSMTGAYTNSYRNWFIQSNINRILDVSVTSPCIHD